MAEQGAAVVGPRLPFPCASRLPVRQSRLQAAAAPRPRGRLRRRAELLVQGLDHPPEAVAGRPALARHDHGGAAEGMQSGAERAVGFGAVARIERSEMREGVPDVASLHPGYDACHTTGSTLVYFTCSSAKLDSIDAT